MKITIQNPPFQLLGVLLCLLLFSGILHAQTTTTIPDTQFEQKLVDLGIDSDGLVNGQILNSDAAGVQYLDLDNETIADLTGLSAFTSLETLKANNNELTSVDLSSNPLLISLELGENQLTTLNLLHNTALQGVKADDNLLNALHLPNTTSLIRLNVSSNMLANIDLSDFVNLENLDVGKNPLTGLDVSNNPNLTKLICSNNNINGTLNLSQNPNLSELYCSFNQLLRLQVANTNIDWLDAQNNLYGLEICVPDTLAALAKPTSGWHSWLKDIHATYISENCGLNVIKGRVVIDSIANCIADSVEQGFINKMVRFERGTEVFYASTYNANGDYIAYLEAGTYMVSVVTGSPYWQSCSVSQTVVLSIGNTVQDIDWPLQAIVSCPQLQVDISAPFLRRVGGGNYYTVDYCNDGTATAFNAYVEVDLAPSLSILNSSIPIANQVGNVYTFDIGSVSMGTCGSFRITVELDSTVLPGQTHCTEAHIYPDAACFSTVWRYSRLGVDAECQRNTVIFTINNYGAAMGQPTTYYVFEDNIMMRQGPVQIGTGASAQVVQQAAPGKTYRIITRQEAGYPSHLGDSIITAAIEGCNPYPDGSFNTGFVTQFSNENTAPFISMDCQQNISSYDPNDKQAQPAGYDRTNHYIYDYTALDYKIRFQNTGTDTAFNITILDTISPYLDLASLEMGASSHNYTWSIQNGNVLNVKFANIMLPDSNVNEPLSNGFFRYKIEQKVNNALGTIINNSAAIYFDFNPPVMTNKTWHTVGADFVTSIVLDQVNILDESIDVIVYPNPFKQATTLEVTGKDYEQLELSVFDVAGRMVKTITSTKHNRIQLSRDGMTPGVYFYQLKGDKELINTGKVIVQ